ncbi:hypothetical protein LTR04_003503 [Oleoguttula sp. CCFEE 6159]|nr:hypothetical protein LTR04_003503 [Oleoguttula sp. CCFEE 6159]
MRLVSTKLDQNDDTSETREGLPRDPYLLPPANTEENKRYWQRLDEDTKLRRRVYELLLADFCRGLKTVDGLDWDRGKVQVKDGTWQRLMELGLVKDQEHDDTLGKTQGGITYTKNAKSPSDAVETVIGKT